MIKVRNKTLCFYNSKELNRQALGMKVSTVQDSHPDFANYQLFFAEKIEFIRRDLIRGLTTVWFKFRSSWLTEFLEQ